MKAAAVFVLICIAALSTTKADGPCDRIGNYDCYLLGTLKACYMPTTAIDSKDFSITSGRDATVKGFIAEYNEQLAFLPNNLGEKFPSLLGLIAGSCPIKEVSRDNFKGLSKLQYLYLGKNQIEKIDDDTFEYIPSIKWIALNLNNIKKLNGRAFASLHKLTTVWLTDNFCIDEDFETATRIAAVQRIVTGKCGFTECEASDLMAQSAELQALKLENAKLQAWNAKLIIEKVKADEQIAHHNELQAQQKKICDARIELKVQEIYHCLKKNPISGDCPR